MMVSERISLSRTSFYAAAYLALVGLPQLVLFLVRPALRAAFGARWWCLPFFVMMATAIVAPFLYTVVQRRLQVTFLRQQRRYLDTLIQGAQGMTMVRELKRLLNLIVHILSRTIRVNNVAVWLFDQKNSQYVLQALRACEGLKVGDMIRADSVLIHRLAWERRPLVKKKLQTNPQRLETDRARTSIEEMERLKATVIIPSFVQDRMVGFVTLSQRKGGEYYSPEDLEVFQVLSNQAALAVENAQFYEELKRTQTDLFQTAKMASLGHMAGGMSHQINNRFHVLTILAGTLKSVMKDTDPKTIDKEQLQELWDKAVETLSKLEENALRGGDIVKTLLRFSRPAGEYKLVTVPQILSTAKEVVQFRVNMAAIDYVQEIPEGLPTVKGDLNQLADSCFNLISNAYDAIQSKTTKIQEKQITPGPNDPNPYKGKISVRARIEKKTERTWVMLEFQDNGTGITPQEMENLFIPFFTTKATTQKGTGLGLYVIQRIMERHGGTIHAASKPGVGTTFTLRIPAAVEKSNAATELGTTPLRETRGGEKSAAA